MTKLLVHHIGESYDQRRKSIILNKDNKKYVLLISKKVIQKIYSEKTLL